MKCLVSCSTGVCVRLALALVLLVVNLIVWLTDSARACCCCRSLEVMRILADMLSFTDEQRVVVGLKVPPLHFLTNIMDRFFPGGSGDGEEDGIASATASIGAPAAAGSGSG